MKLFLLLAGSLLAVLVAIGALRSRKEAANTFGMLPGVSLEARADGAHVDGHRAFILRYAEGGDTSSIRFEYLPVPMPDSGFAFTRGRLESVAGSRATPLLSALARAHGAAPSPHSAATPVSALDLSIGVLGVDLSIGAGPHIIAGAFTPSPAGSWTVLKLFIPAATPEGEQPEIFLALDANRGQAMFLPKDAAYWDGVSRAIGAVAQRQPERE